MGGYGNSNRSYRVEVGVGYKTLGAGSFGTISVSSAMYGGSNVRGTAVIDTTSSGVVVLTTLVSTTSTINHCIGLTTVASHRLLSTSVGSIVENTSFFVMVSSPVGAALNVDWMVINAG